MNDIKHIYKLIVIGNSDIGKTTLCSTYCYGNFYPEKSHTIGVSYLTKHIKDNSGNNCKITLWDTAGQERFQSIVSMYFKNVSGVICMFDTTNKTSLIDCEKWLMELEKHNKNEETKVVLVGNKADLLYPNTKDLNDKKRKFMELHKSTLDNMKEKYSIEETFIISTKDENIDHVFECLIQSMEPLILNESINMLKNNKTKTCKCF